MTAKRLALALVPLIALLRRPGVTAENFQRIEVGMPLPEVERIFGREAR